MGLPARVGRYEVELLLGQGPVGRVLVARDPRLLRRVAIKVQRDDLGLQSGERRAFADLWKGRACTAAGLSHPALVAIHDMGEDEAVGLYVVSELVGPARTLRERLTRGPMTRTEVADLARSLGSALDYVHAAGVSHDNVKPENVFLAVTGPKLSDLGTPRLSDEMRPTDVSWPEANAYRAPEVIASGTHGTSGTEGPRADQFALAAILYEALTGAPAIKRGDPVPVSVPSASASASMVTPAKPILPSLAVPDPRGVRALDAIFDCALAKDPRRRFPSCGAFVTTLAETLEAPSVHLPTPISRSSLIPRATRRWQNTAAGAAVVIIFVLVALGGQRRRAAPRVASEGPSLKDVARAVAASFGGAHAVSSDAGPREQGEAAP